MSKIKTPQIMIDAVRRVDKKQRIRAAKVAEYTYFSTLNQLKAMGFDSQVAEELAAEKAATEVDTLFKGYYPSTVPL